jgi:hypothetical protein
MGCPDASIRAVTMDDDIQVGRFENSIPDSGSAKNGILEAAV